MAKQKTHSGSKKRFKFTGSGKVKRSQGNSRHKKSQKSSKQKRSTRGTTVANKSDHLRINEALPYGKR